MAAASAARGLCPRLLGHIRQARPQWKPSEVRADQLTCALSNEIFKVSHGSEKVLLRVYGAADGCDVAREKEVSRAKFLASFGFGARILHEFNGGRVESWIDGRTPSNSMMRSNGAIHAIAQKLRALHDKTGLNHNDLHRNNMLFTDKGAVEFVDFEYSSPADPTYDIANHFNEWMYPYTGPDQHQFQLSLYPSLPQRREFCSAYLGNPSGKGALVDDFLDEVERRTLDSHAFWVAWAEQNPNEFNTRYAQSRRIFLDGLMNPEAVPSTPEARKVLQDMANSLGTLRELHPWRTLLSTELSGHPQKMQMQQPLC